MEAAMTLAAFRDSLAEARPPDGIPTALAALWWAGKSDWDRAHRLAMSEEGVDCAWVHAYLHRVEGDLDNARYWYGRARRPPPQAKRPGTTDAPATGDLAIEWETIAAALIGATA